MLACNLFGVLIHTISKTLQTELSVPAYTIQHDPTIWGDPEVYRPERWLEKSGEGDRENGAQEAKGRRGDRLPKGPELKKYLLTFGTGPRACIGKK